MCLTGVCGVRNGGLNQIKLQLQKPWTKILLVVNVVNGAFSRVG